MSIPHPPLLLITDRHQARLPLHQVVAAALEGGCRWLLLREKDLSRDERHRLLAPLVSLAGRYRATVCMGGDVALAEEVGAHGVHLPRGGDCRLARCVLGPQALIGYSAHSLTEAEAAAVAGADYVTLSPIFATESKPDYGPALGVVELARVAERLSVPVIALGGITTGNARLCLEAGASGVAVMGGVMRAADPATEAAALVSLVAGSMVAPHFG